MRSLFMRQDRYVSDHSDLPFSRLFMIGPSSRFLLRLFCRLLLIACLCAASPAQAAQKPASATADNTLQKLIAEFDALSRDGKRGGRRDLWLALEKRFQDVESKGKSETAAKAAYYDARAREEMAGRSFLPSDHRNAAARFRAVADTYAKHSVAPAALYRQGLILTQSLQDHAAAASALERLIKNYPRAEDAPAAKTLLARANAAASSAQGSRNAAKTAPSSVSLKNISWKSNGHKAVITLELDTAAEYDVTFAPPDASRKTPGKLHLDIEGAFPSDGIKPRLSPKNLVVSRIRTSHAGNGVRVTLDCDGAQCYLVSSPPKTPRIIQIEVSRRDDIRGGTSVAKADPGQSAGTASAKGGKTVASGTAKRPEALMKELGLTVQTIMLDAGHGGKDPGAIAGSIVEKQFTLAMAKRVGALLRKEGFTVLYTRAGNTFLPLQDRPDIANMKKADLFISIHANANTNARVRGIETYYLDAAKTQDAATVAARENAVSVKNISDLQVILTDLMLNSKLAESRHLADCVHKGILKRLQAGKLPAHDNGYRSAPFYVLMGARMPAILVEFGYITNSDDAANLRSERYLQLQAEGLVQGIKRYKQELARIATK